jgi:DNA-binding MarR family transcriptional regulator
MSTSEVSAEIIRFFRSFKSVQVQMGHRTRHGVDPSAYPVLFQLAEAPKRTTELAGCLHADISTTSRQVTSLVDLGLIERTADPEDRRATILLVTEAGRAVLDDMRAGRERMIARILSDWSETDIKGLVAVLGRFNDDFEQHRAAIIADLDPDPTKEQ